MYHISYFKDGKIVVKDTSEIIDSELVFSKIPYMSTTEMPPTIDFIRDDIIRNTFVSGEVNYMIYCDKEASVYNDKIFIT